MKKIKAIVPFILLCFTLQSCVPDSLTKFKEESVEQQEEVVDDSGPVTLVDESGNEVDSTQVNVPTTLEYTSTTIFTIGQASTLIPSGNLGDLIPDSSFGTVADHHIENLNPRYTIVPTLPSGVEFNTETGVISLSSTATVSPSIATDYAVQLTYRDPSTGNDVTIATTDNTDVSKQSFSFSTQELLPDDIRYSFASAGKMVIKVADNSNFDPSTGISTITTEDGGIATVLFIDSSNNIYIDVTSNEFKVGDRIDNSATYIGPETSIEEVGFFFETAATANVDLVATTDESTTALSATNSLTWTVSPDLPGVSTLSIDTNTASADYGSIVGYVTQAQEIEDYTVTVANGIDSKSFNFKLAISESPRMLAYTDMVVMHVDNDSPFHPGAMITSSIVTPFESGGKGIVKYVNNNYLIVQIIEEGFAADAALDTNSTYTDEKARILEESVEPVSVAIEVADASIFEVYTTTPITTGGIVCHNDDAGGSKGIVTAIDSANNIVFLAIQKNDTSDTQDPDSVGAYPGNIFTGEIYDDSTVTTLDNSTTCDPLNTAAVSSTSINRVWSPSTKINLDQNSANYIRGRDMVIDPASDTVNTGAYVSLLDGSDIYISRNSSTFLTYNDPTSHLKPYSVTGDNITEVSTDTKFELERGVETMIKPLVVTGNDLQYTISPELPTGLSIDAITGIISGTPAETVSRTTYTVTARNVIASKVVNFDLQVYDYFKVAEVSQAPSFILHKSGEVNNNSRCRINKEDILDFQNTQTVDIMCNLDAGESDLFYLGMSLQADVGPGICEHLSITPYSYYAYPPVQTQGLTSSPLRFGIVAGNSCPDIANTVPVGTIINLDSGALSYGDDVDVTAAWVPSMTIFTEKDDFCTGNYDIDGDGEADILCDAGRYTLQEVTFAPGSADTDNDGRCEVTSDNIKEVECGGNPKACLYGGIRDVLSKEAIEETNTTGVITASWTGLEQLWEFDSPLSRGSGSNVSLANSTVSNSCTTTASEFTYTPKGFVSHANSPSSYSDIADPFMGGHPYYTISCLDAAYDLKARIRVNVRDWDRAFTRIATDEIDSFFPEVLSAGSDADLQMDSPSTEVDNFGDAWNDIADWDDYFTTGSFAACDDTPTAPTLSSGIAAITGTATVNEKTITVSAGITVRKGTKITLNGTDTYTIASDITGGTSIPVMEFIHTTRAGVAATVYDSYRFPFAGFAN